MADTSSDSVETNQEPSFDKDSVECLAGSDNSESNFGGVLSTPRLANNPFAVKTIIPTRSVADSTDNKELRPILAPATFTPSRGQGEPDAARSNCPSSSFKLNPPALANPFAKFDSVAAVERRSELPEVSTSKESELSDDSTQDSSSTLEAKSSASATCVIVSPITSTVVVDAAVTNSNNNAESRFSIIKTPPQLNSLSQSCQNVDFVFGQKMNERVANSVSVSLSNAATANGTSELLFSQNLQSESGESDGEVAQTNGESSGRTAKSLEESAQEYESRKVKRTYEEVLVVTGEEEESNVLQINCKLFVFDKTTSSWLERGRGALRLNDKDELQDGSLQSRLVMRTQGSLRVVLNTKVWAAMAVERPSSKSVQITAMDADTIRVFLIMASPNDAEQLHNALNWRVSTLRTAEEQRSSSEKRVRDDVPHCLPSTTTSEESSCSPKRRRVTPPGSLEDDSSGSECGPNIQDTSIDSTSRNKATSFEGTTTPEPS